MANPFVHLEFSTSDLGAAKKFYGDMFGWTFTDMDMGGGMIYSLFKPDDGPGGGMMANPGAPIAWTAYVDVNGNGAMDAGEPSALSSSAGTFTIPDVAPDCSSRTAESGTSVLANSRRSI